MPFKSVTVFKWYLTLVIYIELHFPGWNSIPHAFSHFSRRCRFSCRTLQSSFVYMFLYNIQTSAKSRGLDETDDGRSLMNIKNRRGPILILVVLHWLLVVDLTFHHPVKPVEFCLTERILPISRCYLLFHNSPFSSVVYYEALYWMPWINPIWWGQFGYPMKIFCQLMWESQQMCLAATFGPKSMLTVY